MIARDPVTLAVPVRPCPTVTSVPLTTRTFDPVVSACSRPDRLATMTRRSHPARYLRPSSRPGFGGLRLDSAGAGPPVRTQAHRGRPRRVLVGGGGAGPARLSAGRPIRCRRRADRHDPHRDRPRRRHLAARGARQRGLSGDRLSRRPGPALPRAIDHRGRHAAAGLRVADPAAVVRGGLSMADRPAGDQPVQRVRGRAPDPGRDGAAPAPVPRRRRDRRDHHAPVRRPVRDGGGGQRHGAARYSARGVALRPDDRDRSTTALRRAARERARVRTSTCT